MLQSREFGFRWRESVEKRHTKPHTPKRWYPSGLQWWNLIIAIILCCTFAALLRCYLWKSQTQGGVIFARKINDLPLHISFWYLYLPTIIAVLFSIFIVWIDHDAKRYEPYRHMSQSRGALAKDSILLHYPFDFALFVPIMAAKRKHWLVFFASVASFSTTFAVVPLQAGIFSTRTIIQNFPQDFNISANFIHSSAQEHALTLSYTQSAYGILKLNETLPAFTTRNYTLKPFNPSNDGLSQGDSWTTESVLYSMNLECEKGRPSGPTNFTWVVEETRRNLSSHGGASRDVRVNETYHVVHDSGFNSSAGCYVGHPEHNNNTEGSRLTPQSDPEAKMYRKYSASYMGYYAIKHPFRAGLGEDHLGNSLGCGAHGNGTFFATFARNKKNELDPETEVTAIFCKPKYYEQDVKATVDATTGHPLHVAFKGTKRQISADVFNATVFEDTLASGEHPLQTRDEALPTTRLPQCLEYLFNSDLTPPLYEAPHIMTTVMSEATHRFQELLDPQKLGESYEVIYQLFFARAMADILKPNFTTPGTVTTGMRETEMEAVVLQPIFVYLVEAFLGLISVAMLALVYIGYLDRTSGNLVDDPASITSVMSMVANDKYLLEMFGDLDCASKQYLKRKLSVRRYKLGNDVSNHCMTIVKQSQQTLLEGKEVKDSDEQRLSEPMRPTEFHGTTATLCISLFVTLMITLAVLFATSKPRGLALPSKDRIIQNLLTNYIPTVTATLIESGWIVVNRLLCVLQPLEQLRGGTGAVASRSLTVNYSSLPPQLTIIKAIQSRHITMIAVCAMSLLGNLLTTAFAGLFSSATLPLSHPMLFSPPFEPKLININASWGPPIEGARSWINCAETSLSGVYEGSMGENHFFIAESNLTRNTPLPSWTDENAMYLPFIDSSSSTLDIESTYQARTKYFTAEPRCKPLSFGKDYHIHLWVADSIHSENTLFNVTVPSPSGKQVTCYGTNQNEFVGYYGYPSLRDGSTRCRNGVTAAEMVTTLVSSSMTDTEALETCRSAVVVGWMRATQQYCDVPFPEYYPANSSKTSWEGFEDAASNNTFLMLCQPKWQIGDATVVVSSTGVLQEPAKDLTVDQDQAPQALDKYFINSSTSAISQSNMFIFRTMQPWWHNDTFASEFMHHFINRVEGSLRLTDPTQPLPTFADVDGPMKKAYARLFAIWLSVDKEYLFQRATNTTAQVRGSIITHEERLFFVTPLLIISEIVLALYIVVAIVVYLRRPGRYLPRMPISIAAIIALFASSAAVKDFQGTSSMNNKEREKYLKDLNHRYGYGSYVGGDGGVHVGIEKVPFVSYMKEVSFKGSRAEKEMRKRNAKGSTSPEHVHSLLGNTEDRRTALS